MSETERRNPGAGPSEFERTVREDLLPLADLLEETFARTARTIEQELTEAAKSGSLSFKTMVEEILNDLARLAAEELIREPLENAILRALGGNTQAGTRQSETQIAATLAEALSRAGRNG